MFEPTRRSDFDRFIKAKGLCRESETAQNMAQYFATVRDDDATAGVVNSLDTWLSCSMIGAQTNTKERRIRLGSSVVFY